MPDLPITALPELSQEAVAPNDVLPITSIAAAETKKITTRHLLLGTIADLNDGEIPGEKVNFTLPPNSVNTIHIVDNAVTAEKLADNSTVLVGETQPPAGDFIGQGFYNTISGESFIWNGSAWESRNFGVNDIRAVNAPNNIIVATTGPDENGVVEIAAVYGETQNAREFVAGPVATGGTITQRPIESGDLPGATDTEQGAVVPGDGLTASNGVISIDNVVTPQTERSLVTFDANGLVTSGSPIESDDLPLATDSDVGVIVPGPDLSVDANGQLLIDNTVSPGPGTYSKVTVNEVGLVTAGSNDPLTEDEIPSLDADKIGSGELDPDRIADHSILAAKLGDYSTCLIQEDHPGAGEFLGQFWYTPSTAQLRVYARGSGPENIWLPVGFGALAQQNLRVGFTYNADTATIVTTTSYGTIAGLTPGESIPNPTDELIGVYGVCVTDGNSITVPNLTGTVHTPGDWILCLGQTEGWVHIDVTQNGGGGGGAQVLDDLLDVTINDGSIDTVDLDPIPAVALEDGQLLKYRASDGMWRNSNIIDCGTF